MNPTILDLSHYQADVNFDSVKKAGILAVILKCTEGTSYVDKTFAGRYKAAKAAGLVVSSYHFLKSGSITRQINHYLGNLSPEDGERVVIDYEDAACTLSDLHQAVQALFDDERKLQITVYGGSKLKVDLGSSKDPVLSENTSLWLSQWTTGGISWPRGTWPNWSLWQFSESCKVSGVSGLVDGNVFNGSNDNLVKYLSPAMGGPSPEPEVVSKVKLSFTSEQKVEIQVTGSANVSVTVV